MDTNFGNDNSAGSAPPEPIMEPTQTNDSTPDNLSDNHFDNANVMNLTPQSLSTKKVGGTNEKKPDPKELADVFKQSFEDEKKKSKKGQIQYLYYLIVFVIILTGLLFIRQMSLQRQIDELKTSISVTIVPVNPEVSSSPSTSQVIKIVQPEEFAELSGILDYDIEVESIRNLTIKVFDDTGVEIGSYLERNIELVENKATLTNSINITKSPSISVGYIVAYPSDSDLNSPLAQTTSVNFLKSSVADKISVFGPIKDQLINTTKLDFSGEIKGFKDEKVGVRVSDTSGKVLLDTELQGSTEKNSQDFVKIESTLDISTLSGISDTGVVEFYDVSSSSSTSLLSIPVRFK